MSNAQLDRNLAAVRLMTGADVGPAGGGGDNTLLYVVLACIVCCCLSSLVLLWLYKAGKLDGLGIPFLPKSADVFGSGDANSAGSPIVDPAAVDPSAAIALSTDPLTPTPTPAPAQAVAQAPTMSSSARRVAKKGAKKKALLTPPRTTSAGANRVVRPAQAKSLKPGTAPAYHVKPLRR